MVHLVMFDIDGTLVDSMEFDGRLYAEAIHEVLGIVVDRDWSTYPHVTDGGLLEEVLRRHGLADPDGARHRAVKQRFIAMIRDHIRDDPASIREIPGAAMLLGLLRQRADCRVAIATGGWRETALLKLDAAGFDLDGIALATSSDAHPRVEIMQIAASRALGGLQPGHRTYFGDGPWDQRACRDLGWDFIAIGGNVTHDPAFDSFSDKAAILSTLGF
jgi:beta-phosphoglucomutase-like phosphatase (HAD superfamily)